MITGYNERSWAIDLIGYLKSISSNQDRPVKEVGGERNVASFGSSAYPDVLLFGDIGSARILQGWELKFPDTSIDDTAFRENAEMKAQMLGLNSFVLWNVTEARLYILDEDTDEFRIRRSWPALRDIKTRRDVARNRLRWQEVASQILAEVNQYLVTGEIDGRRFVDSYRSGGVTRMINENIGELAQALRNTAAMDRSFRTSKDVWWATVQSSYGAQTWDLALAGSVLNNWTSKFLFANILRAHFDDANQVSQIDQATTPVAALVIFRELSISIDFKPIFADGIGLDKLTERAWSDLRQFGNLLADLKIGSVEQKQVSELFEATVNYSSRRLRGQFTTPLDLARLCVHLSLDNIRAARVLDPCCGSGTIPRAAAALKRHHDTPVAAIAEHIYAGDIDALATQVATFALTGPDMFRLPVRVFTENALELTVHSQVRFQDPTTGNEIHEPLGEFDAIISNLPFVSQEGRKPFQRYFDQINQELAMADMTTLPGNADLSAYVAMKISLLVKDGGYLCLILPNSWLGTAWGDAMRSSLSRDFRLETVITSGAGRWFLNSDVIANVVVLRKRTSVPPSAQDTTKFVVMRSPLEEFSDEDSFASLVGHIQLGLENDSTHSINSVTRDALARFASLGLAGNAQFVDCDWVLELPLRPLRELADIKRGERRGLNALFYPAPGHGIEDEYLLPLLKSSTEISGLVATPTREAFVCSRSISEIETLGHSGARSWIASFDTESNRKKLSKAKLHWYQMDASRLSDMVIPMAPNRRLFISRMVPRAFVDQRFVSLVLYDNSDEAAAILHALLNTAISYFFIEGIGFGRGLGVLDLNKDRLEAVLHVLDSNVLSGPSVDSILTAFQPLLLRDVLPIEEELESEDRIAFDTRVIQEFKLPVSVDQVYSSLLELVAVRGNGSRRLVGT